MAGILIGRREDGRWVLRATGCCGDAEATRSMYERAHAVQVLGEGGRLAGWDADGFELRDRRGRAHRYPRSWRQASSISSSGT